MNNNLVTEIARTIDAYHRCVELNNTEWQPKHREHLKELCEELPSGSGIDRGIQLDLDASTGERLVFQLSYHHMNDGGYYDGWTEHTVTVTPSLIHGFTLKISGRDRNQIKDYLQDTIQCALSAELPVTSVTRQTSAQHSPNIMTSLTLPVIQLPTIHINGTSPEMILEFNQRDYYPVQGSWEIALADGSATARWRESCEANYAMD